jgi:hypothetical protein
LRLPPRPLSPPPPPAAVAAVATAAAVVHVDVAAIRDAAGINSPDLIRRAVFDYRSAISSMIDQCQELSDAFAGFEVHEDYIILALGPMLLEDYTAAYDTAERVHDFAQVLLSLSGALFRLATAPWGDFLRESCSRVGGGARRIGEVHHALRSDPLKRPHAAARAAQQQSEATARRCENSAFQPVVTDAQDGKRSHVSCLTRAFA